jgi:hypothetical protein
MNSNVNKTFYGDLRLCFNKKFALSNLHRNYRYELLKELFYNEWFIFPMHVSPNVCYEI